MVNRALRLLRTYHRMTQQKLADRLEISNTYLSEIETGAKDPNLELLAKYSSLFGIPVSSILLFSERIESGNAGDRLRFAASQKILKVLEWIEEGETVAQNT